MTQDELKAWALKSGWTVIGGVPSLTKPSAPKEAIVRMVLKATVVHVEAKKPAGKWEKLSGARYGDVVADEETGVPGGLGLDTLPGFRRADAGEPGPAGVCAIGWVRTAEKLGPWVLRGSALHPEGDSHPLHPFMKELDGPLIGSGQSPYSHVGTTHPSWQGVR